MGGEACLSGGLCEEGWGGGGGGGEELDDMVTADVECYEDRQKGRD